MQKAFAQYKYDTPELTCAGLNTYARVVDVIDGDTIVCIIPMFEKFFRFHTRLSGIDTCEMKSKDFDTRNKALKARNFVLETITNVIFDLECEKKIIRNFLDENIICVWLNCLEFDKYGRLLAKVYKDIEDLNDLSTLLVDNKLAYRYDGGTKLMF